MISRRSSQMRTTTYESVISSTEPVSCLSPATTTSPTRIASVNANCKPAKTLPSVCWAARPAMTERTPAEARTVVIAWRAASNVPTIATAPITTTTPCVKRRKTCAWVSKRRERPLSDS